MKPTMLTLLSCLLFIIALSTNPHPTSADDTSPPVLDTDGEEVRPGVNYFILPANRLDGGGLTLARPRNGTCPLDIVQEPNRPNDGFPLAFFPVDRNDEVVRVSTDLNVRFVALTQCDQSTVWRLSGPTSPGRPYFVTVGGVEGNPGRETLSNWFNIQRNGDAYNIAFCPTVCNYCRPICGDIGILVENGTRRLALSQNPFRVVFRRVTV